MKIRLSDLAQADLLQIWSYLAENNEANADRFLDDIMAQFDRLLSFPEMGRKRKDLGRDYRSFLLKNYVIFYRIIDSTVEVSRVLHGARNLQDLL